METQERMEREICLKDLFWNILFAWRSIICFGLIFAILLSGMKYVRDIRNYQRVKNIDENTQTEIELTGEELEKVANARDLQARIEEYQNYLDTSVLMQMDPYEKHIVELQYYVESDYVYNYTQDNQMNYTDAVTAVYGNYIGSGEMSRKVIEEAGLSVSQEDFSELLSVKQSGTSIYITIGYPDEKKLEEIAAVMKSLLSQKEPELQQIGSHELKLVGESKNVVTDGDLMERKNAISNNIVSLNTQLSTLKASMTEQQLSMLDGEKDDESQENIQKTNIKPAFSKKYMLLGAFVGIFLVCVWIVFRIIFTARLQNPDEIRSLYRLRLLGEINGQKGKKRFLSVIDDKLISLKNRRRKKLSKEQQIKIVSANIALTCRQQGIDHIYITGSEYENIDTTTMDLLKQELAAQNIQVKEGVNIFYDAASLEKGTEIGTILFIEQQNLSIYDEISNEINLAKEHKVSILGAVVLV